jgi:hypothetical protein
MDATPPVNPGQSRGAIPFAHPNHVARAYGVKPVARVQPAQPVTSVEPVARIDAADAGSKTDPRLGRLVAATVPGGVSFEGGVPKPTTSAIPFYRHPADKNAAATAVNLGRVLDAKG